LELPQVSVCGYADKYAQSSKAALVRGSSTLHNSDQRRMLHIFLL